MGLKHRAAKIWSALRREKYRVEYAVIGAVLGLGSPVGALLFRWVLESHQGSTLAWAIEELRINGFFYLYQTIGTVLVFALAGLWAGSAYGRLDHLSEHLRELSLQDPLTELYNRRYLEARLGEEMGRHQRSGQAFSCLMIDIDHFKRLNDVYGHLAGDTVLRELSGRLRAACRVGDVVGRFGGEEFLVILPNTDGATALQMGERLRRTIADSPFLFDLQPLPVRVSVGAAEYYGIDSAIERFIEDADRAMYSAKAQGRDRVVLARR